MAHIQKRGDRWRAEVRRQGVGRSKSFATKKDAEAWARQLETGIERGLVVTAAGASGTLADLLTKYEEDVWPLKKWGTSKAYELKQLRADLGTKTVRNIDRTMITEYAKGLRERMGGAGVATRLSYLVEVFRAARDLWQAAVPLEDAEAAVASLKRQKVLTRSQPRTRRPLDKELDRVVAYATASAKMEVDLAAIVTVLRVLPLRIGELCAIEWDDLRPGERAVVIRARKHPDVLVKAGNDYVVPLLTVDGIDTWELVSGRPRYFDRPFPYIRHTVSSSWWVAAKALAIEDLHLHDLRAGAISRLLEAGVPVPVVAHLSGHRNWKVLAKHYTRLDPSNMHETVARFLAAGAAS